MQLLNSPNKTGVLVIAGTILAALGGLAAWLKYRDDKKREPLSNDVLKLEHELKLLQIEKAKADLGKKI